MTELVFKNIIPILLVLVIIFMFSFIGFVRVPMDKAAFISGFRKRVIVGKLGFFMRYFERVDYLDLSLFSVDVNTSVFVPTNDFINIKADAIVKLQISQEPEILNIASKNFLNKKSELIGESVKEVLEGNLREIIGQMNLKDMVQNRKEFNVKVQENVSPDLKEMGLVVVSFAVQSFTDEKGVIDNLGIENISRISKDASIAKAEAEKEVAIAKANADKEAKDIELKVAEEIAEKTNKLEIKKADLKIESDTRKASADMTYQLETERKRKELEEVQGESNFTRETQAIKTNQAKLEAEIKVDNQIKSDAELYRKTKEAESRLIEEQREAEARLYKQTKEADALKIMAEREAEAVKIKAQAEAESIKMKALAEAESKKEIGLAEAEAIKAKAVAEAEGIDKKADAMKKYGEAAILEMYFKALPEIAKNIASPLNNIDKITMYGEGNSSKLIEDITKSISQINNGISDATGLDLKSVLAGALGGKLLSEKNDKEKGPEK